ncbi:MAG: NTP transferase domain-containing protein [Sedimentisphaerales bacterium]|nr:NTP transferase domain-containing protein [Sedimentisphaerales bacterium]
MVKRVAIILAAGISSRMKTLVPKVLHEVCGRPMLAYVLDACRDAGVDRIYVIIGHGGEQVQQRFSGADDIVWVEQAEQLGTAHAVLCCKEQLADFDGQTLVLCGDGPLIRAKALQSLIEKYESGDYAAVLATAVLDEPAGYGRIIRDSNGNIEAIVEHNDCTGQQLKIKEVNPSYYLFDNKVLFEALAEVKCDNAKGEYYITDTVEIILSKGLKAAAVVAVEPEEAMGANDRRQLSIIGRIMQQRIQERLMAEGVTIVDPANTWIDSRAEIGADTIIEPFSYIQGKVKIGKACRIGPFAYLIDGTILKDGAVVDPSEILRQAENVKSCTEAER